MIKNMIHKKSTSLILGLLLLLSTFAGCKKVDPFSGEDNFILSFELSGTEGNAYKGTLSGDEITIRIPSNIARSSLSAKYTLSEMATVTPKPEEVKNWKNSQTFTVTSYSGATRNYTVKLHITDVAVSNTVRFTTDEEFAQFANNGADIINGNLILGSENSKDTIYSLEGLAKLKEVRYNLVIYNNVKADLSPLFNSLERIGSLQFVGNNDKIETLDLPKLRVMPKGMSINSTTLKSISMPALEEVGDVDARCVHCTSVNMPQLRYVYGNFRFIAPLVEVLDFPELTSVQNITLNFRSETLNLVKLSMPKLENAQEISVQEAYYLDELNLHSLRKADILYLSAPVSLKVFDLSNLESVQSFQFFGLYDDGDDDDESDINEVIAEISLPKLNSVKSLSFFGELNALRLQSLKEVEDISLPVVLTTYEAPLLNKVSRFYMSNFLPSMVEHLEEVELLSIDLREYSGKHESINMSSIGKMKDLGINLCELDLVVFPKNVYGTIRLDFNSCPINKVPKMEGLVECGSIDIAPIYQGSFDIKLPETLKLINGALSVDNGIRNITAKGLVKARDVKLNNSNIEYLDMPLLETIDGTMDLRTKYLKDANFPKLTNVKNLLVGSDGSWNANIELTNLNFLSSLQKVESFKITYCTKLRDYTGLKQLVENGQINESNWTSNKVNNNLYNPTYQDLKAGRYKLP